jgi:monofunctional biosynthetic peptidoglycan transglycosylase
MTQPAVDPRMDEIRTTLPPPPAPRRGGLRRLVRRLFKAVLWFVGLSVLWVAIYRVVPPPVTATMIANLADGRGITKDWMPLDRMDPHMARAAIAAEDARFCLHHGFDYAAMKTAFAANERGHKLRGGSTISQQTAKNVFLWQGRSYVRKAFEAWFTLLIETIWGKKRIMEVYLNVAETGIGTFGVNAGAIRYFHHDAGRLSPAEAARLMAVFPLPKKRGAVAPEGYVRRYGNRIAAREPAVARDGLDRCLR